jgi:hypothetical protein
MGQQLLFDFAQLDPVTAHLQLLVARPRYCNWSSARWRTQVAGAVQALAVAERVGTKRSAVSPGSR